MMRRLGTLFAALLVLAAPAHAQDIVARGIASRAGSQSSFDDRAAVRGLATPAIAARRILASAAKGLTPIRNTLATPPTFSVGAVNANSTINTGTNTGSPAFLANNPKVMTPIGGPAESVGGNSMQIKGPISTLAPTARRGGHGSGWRFAMDGSAFDISAYNQSYAMAVYVIDPATGQRLRTQATDYATAAGQIYYKVDFGTAAVRIIEIYTSPYGWVNGINVAGGTAWAMPPNEPRIAFIGDSWMDGIGSGNSNANKLTVSDFVGERLGVANPLVFGVGSTGLLGGNGVAVAGTYRQRVEAGDINVSRIGAMEAVVVWTTLNDRDITPAALQAEITLLVKAVRVAQPSAIIIVIGPEITTSANTSQAVFDAIKAGTAVAQATDANLLYIDNGPTGENWYYSGSGAAYVGSDGYHANSPGMAYFGLRAGDGIIAALRARYAF